MTVNLKLTGTLGSDLLSGDLGNDTILGGAGDIAFVAPYVSGLVGVGAMGEGAHSLKETVYLDSIPTQAKRMAVLMYRLSKQR